VYVPTNFFLEKLLAQLIDHAIAGPFSGVLDGTFVGLAQFPSTTLNPSDGLSALTQATYSGYARQPIVWHGPYTDGAGQQAIQSGNLYFQPTDALTPNQITMMFVADALTGGNLLFSEVLPGGPIFLTDATTAFGLSVVFQLPANANFGDAVIIH
jgi:hypothetical protein